MMNEMVTDRVREFADSLLPPMGLALYDVQFRPEGHGLVLRLVIDTVRRGERVTLDDCSRVSRETSDFLDVEDIIDAPYHLEVSSPGVERALRTPAECERFVGDKVRIKLREERDGRKLFVGTLTGVAGDEVTVVTEEGSEHTFLFNAVKNARLTL